MNLPDPLEIQPVSRPIRGAIRPPGSKSLTNRALVCAALAEGKSTLTGALDSEDTQVMCRALAALGFELSFDTQAATIEIEGGGGRIPAEHADLYVANSGTTVRFLTAMLALGQGRYRLDGTARMRERPIEDLLSALRALGVEARCEAASGCPPVVLEARGLAGGQVRIAGGVSSQFLSGLLLAARYAREPLEIEVAGELVSQPYVAMTLAVMRSFGVEAAADGLSRFRFAPGRGYQGRVYEIEPDASAASYFLAAAAITGGEITIHGLGRDSLQGDVAFADLLGQMGCGVRWEANQVTVIGGPLRGIDVDMNAISDTVQTLGAVALFAHGPTTIRGVGHIRHKETDRIAALATELRKLGAIIEERADGLQIEGTHPNPAALATVAPLSAVPPPAIRELPTPPAHLHGADIATYRDHRMAMSLSLCGLLVPGVRIKDPGCVEKTYPGFYGDLERAKLLG